MVAHFGLATDPSAVVDVAYVDRPLILQKRCTACGLVQVYRLGKLMLSLAGGDASPTDGAQPSVRMTEDTRTTVFSCTKVR